ncbi:MAG TPA: DUF255 domain-containing protein [Nitrospiria bacterium]|nr:DUF255 domain-containing protein [Nitrospiria bacterium]
MQNTEQIHWRPWGSDAFQEARESSRPIFLSISAVWCHWCHVMDGESFDHPEVIRRLNRDFIPIRVDSDKRPDINGRYNMGGWPTVAVLDADGQVIVGDTYLPTGRLLELLSQVQKDREPGPARPALSKAVDGNAARKPQAADALPLALETIANFLTRAFDPEYGGFGGPPKFPQPWAIELVMHLHDRGDRPSGLDMAKATLDHMRDGGLRDPVDGGFFRYATRGDWDRPHYEKLLEVNARMLTVYLRAHRLTGDASYRFTSYDILDYLYTSLAVEGEAWFCGSQSADEDYYALSEEDRAGVEAPRRDRTLYTDQNAAAASALLLAGHLLKDHAYQTSALQLINVLLARCRHAELGMYHCLDERLSLPGYLSDQVHMIAALADAFEATGEKRYMDHADELAGIMNLHLWDENAGAYWDLPAAAGPPEKSDREGILKVRIKPLYENAVAAIGLVRLFHLTGDEGYRGRARGTLNYLAGVYRPYKHHAAPFGLALERFLYPPRHVTVVGRRTDPQWKALTAAAHRMKAPWKVVLPLDSEESRDRVASLGYPVASQPAAYVCIGTTCLPPVLRPEDLENLK